MYIFKCEDRNTKHIANLWMKLTFFTKIKFMQDESGEQIGGSVVDIYT